MKKVILRFLLPAGITAAGLAVAVVLVVAAPSAERSEPSPTVARVEVVEAQPIVAPALIDATGVVSAAREVPITPEVNGKVVALADELIPGGRFTQGQILARIDRRDYELAVDQERSRVRQAELELELEQGRGAIAEREWALLGDGRDPDEARLALRKPQLDTAERNLEAARSGLERAELNLERTVLRAPFNAMVLSEDVEVGQLVGPTAPIARLVGTDEVWVQVSVPVERLPVLSIPGYGEAEQGSPATVVLDLGGDEVTRRGEVIQLLGELDPETRTAQVLVSIDDPLRGGALPLLPGAFVHVTLEGAALSGVIEVPRQAVVDGDAVWIADADDRLARREVAIGWRTDEALYVTDGLSRGDRIVTTPLSLPVEGMALAVQSQGTPVADAN